MLYGQKEISLEVIELSTQTFRTTLFMILWTVVSGGSLSQLPVRQSWANMAGKLTNFRQNHWLQ